MTREELQTGATQSLVQYKRLIAEWCTGLGKSMIALGFIKTHPFTKCLIFVPETNNIENWRDEFKKFGVDDSRVTISCYASIHKYKNTSWDLLVFDEAPHINTDRRLGFSESIQGDYVLALGAVISKEEREALEAYYGNFSVSRVPLKKAIEWGILPPPTINVLHMKMDDKVKRNWWYGERLTDQQMYDKFEAQVADARADFMEEGDIVSEDKMLRAGGRRKRFLGSIKTAAIARVCNELNKRNRRFLCFCSSIKQAKALGKTNSFTSLTPASQKPLAKFNNHEINSLYVVGKLIEGQNLKDIDCGVIGQLGGTSRITIQSAGRIMRSPNPVIWVPIFDGTKDESFLTTLTSEVPDTCVKHYKF